MYGFHRLVSVLYSSCRRFAERFEGYGGRISRSVAVMEHDEQTGITAEKAGEYVAEKALHPKVPVLCTLGGKYKLFVFLTRLLPTRVLTELVGEIYAK